MNLAARVIYVGSWHDIPPWGIGLLVVLSLAGLAAWMYEKTKRN